ncbi:MAG: hypothetical protein JST11_02785 [Acidobacteria bacterium]|nr:hypothetical protein [Acidobacteriota bacterium]
MPLTEKRLSLAILLLVIVVQAISLAPELTTAAYRNNDSVSHYALIRGMVDAIEHGQSPLDFWSAETSLGLPLARWYQPLSHLIVVAAYFAFGKAISLMTLLLWAKYLAILLLPVSFYGCARLLDFPPLEAAACALLVPLMGGPGPGQMGTEWRTWLGFGAYPQAVGSNLLLWSIGVSYRAIRGGRNVVLAGALVGLNLTAHLIYGWMAALIACLIAVLPDEIPRVARIRRTAAMGVVAAMLSGFLIAGILEDGALINRSRLEPASKYDSYGAGQVLSWLFSGQMLDHDRIPVLSLLALGGIALMLWRWRKRGDLSRAEWLVLWCELFFLLVLFGRPTWGGLLILIGATRDLQLHRVLGVVQIFLLLPAGLALAALWRYIAGRWHFAASAALTLVLLFPLAQERAAFLSAHTEQGWATYNAVQETGGTLEQAIGAAAARGGRVFAGLPQTWGSRLVLGRTPVFAFLMTHMVPSLDVYYNVSALPSDLVPKFDQNHALDYRTFNVRAVIAPKVAPPDFLKTIGDYGNYRVLAAPGEGYFGMIDVVAMATADRDSFYALSEPWLHSPWAAADRYIRLDFTGDAPRDLPRVTPGYFPDVPLPAGPPGTVRNERQNWQIYEADLDAPRAAFVVFRMTYHPGWKALLDGRPAATFMVTPGFLAAAVPAGQHHIRCAYEPGTARSWMAVGGLGIVIALLAGARFLPAL